MHPKNLAALCLIAAGVLLTPPLAAQSPSTPGLRVDLKIATPEVQPQGPLTLQFTLTNTSGEELSILKWHTPLEGIRSNMFRIERNGTPEPYLGVLVKRGAPTAEEVVVLPKGGSVSATVDLFKAYGIFEPGDYTVQYVGTLFIVHGGKAGLSQPNHGLERAELESTPARFKLLAPRTPSAAVSKALKMPRLKPEPSLRLDMTTSLTFDNCSADQASALGDAYNLATQMAAYGGLELFLSVLSGKPNAPYLTWFGAYDAARYHTVSANFSAIYNALAHTQALTLHCSDRNEDHCYPLLNTFAFVYPVSAYDIYVCPLYWTQPLTGLDSQAETLVHEMSHFDVVAKTDDIGTGAATCMWLAAHDPIKAITNADSYGDFAASVSPMP